MTDDGEWVLNEPYRTHLQNARLTATQAWTSALIGYVAEYSMYEADELKGHLLRIASEHDVPPSEVVNEFVIRALEKDL